MQGDADVEEFCRCTGENAATGEVVGGRHDASVCASGKGTSGEGVAMVVIRACAKMEESRIGTGADFQQEEAACRRNADEKAM